MNKYGQSAIEAAKLCQQNGHLSPKTAWEQAVTNLFDTSASRKKGCPRNAFLGLCEEGLVRDIPAGNYTGSVKNKRYALRAVSFLRQDARLADDLEHLWKMVMAGEDEPKSHNQQMEVVAALWKQGLIR